ncbi:hypothetical protein WR25_03193 isoform A [Diploscapter pachys]|uniref:glucuronosyltransferase n=1 Tax=Diploscapter pachys TaxID=2018661 RepID=A0A2A2KZ37_9BILA|nr:hypothetical protein WR25_03193 isoform A [Diploscapter pachys]
MSQQSEIVCRDRRGHRLHHNVITVKPILIPEEPRLVKPKLHLVREKTVKNVLPKSLYEPLEEIAKKLPWEDEYRIDAFDKVYWAAHNASCYKILNSNLMDTLKQENLDIAIAYGSNPCQLAVTHILAVPTIYFDLEGLTDETLIASGSPLDLSYPPSHCNTNENDHIMMKFMRHSFCYLKEYLAQSELPFIASLVSERHRLLDGPITKMFAEDYTIKKRYNGFPDVDQLKRHSAAFFVNTDPLLEYQRALPPHVIPVGGLHIDHPKPLFAPWNTTIESAEEGMIIVSLGTQADSGYMTEKQRLAIADALSKLTKYRIYWRIGPNMNRLLQTTNSLEKDLPKHINLTTYIPQNDLLAHKACKLLVTNGGMASIMEAVAHGVPIVGIPLYGSNRHNLRKVQYKGLGVILEKTELSSASLLKAMKAVLEGSKHKTIAKEMSKEFKSRSESPFAKALHYIEHIGRHHSNAYLGSRYIIFILKLNILHMVINY